MKKAIILLLSLILLPSLMFSWEWKKEGNTIYVNPNKKGSAVGPTNTAPWFNPDYKNLNIVINDGITEIKDKTFALSDNIVSVTIPKSVKKIGKEAFAGCMNLTKVVLTSSVEEIGERAFYDCESLPYVYVPNKNAKIGNDAFTKSHTKVVEYNNSKQKDKA